MHYIFLNLYESITNILSITFLNLLGQNISMKSPTSDQCHYLLEKSIFLEIFNDIYVKYMSHYRNYHGLGWLMSK